MNCKNTNWIRRSI